MGAFCGAPGERTTKPFRGYFGAAFPISYETRYLFKLFFVPENNWNNPQKNAMQLVFRILYQ